MAVKKTTGKSPRRRPRSRARMQAPLLKALAAVGVLAAMVLATLLVVRGLAPERPRPVAAGKPGTARPELPAAKTQPPVRTAEESPASHRPAATGAPDKDKSDPPQPIHEIYPKKEPQPPAEENEKWRAALPAPPPEPVPGRKLPRVAIIIDDLGYDRHLAEKLAQLNAPLTFAILPFSPHQDHASRLALTHRLETLLHLPMEPIEYPDIKPGPGALLSHMSPDQRLRVLEADLDALPYIKGVNNHMGSRLTAQSEIMYQIFSVLKQRGLFFVDSRTTDETVCRPSARLFQLPFAQRDVFLDHSTDPASIRRQIRLLVRIAYQKKEAIGIGHPNPSTVAVLRDMLPELQREVEIVPVSHLVHPEG